MARVVLLSTLINTVLSQSSVCIWGKLDWNSRINGLYAHAGSYGSKPYYLMSDGCFEFYLFWHATNSQWRIHTSLNQNSSHAYCTSSTLSDCNAWYVYTEADTFELYPSTQLFVDACPSWECDKVEINNLGNGCDTLFDVHLGDNLWTNSQSTRYWYFYPSASFKWKCNEWDPTTSDDPCGNEKVGKLFAGWDNNYISGGQSLSMAIDPSGHATIKCIMDPTPSPTTYPTRLPTNAPTWNPSNPPTLNPSNPSLPPTNNPSNMPTFNPSNHPTNTPSYIPTNNPSHPPTNNPSNPSSNPTNNPTENPSNHPTNNPSNYPSKHPTNDPTNHPTNYPTSNPSHHSRAPTLNPSIPPTLNPSNIPTLITLNPSDIPTSLPSHFPSSNPSNSPTRNPSPIPTSITSSPTPNPSNERISLPPSSEISIQMKSTNNGQKLEPNSKDGFVYISLCVVGVCVLVACVLYIKRQYQRKKEAIIHIESVQQPKQTISMVTSMTIQSEVTNVAVVPDGDDEKAVKQWLKDTVKLSQYAQAFLSNGYESMVIVADISKRKELEEIGITIPGHQVRIMTKIKQLQNEQNVVPGSPDGHEPHDTTNRFIMDESEEEDESEPGPQPEGDMEGAMEVTDGQTKGMEEMEQYIGDDEFIVDESGDDSAHLVETDRGDHQLTKGFIE
eukprot:396486_1